MMTTHVDDMLVAAASIDIVAQLKEILEQDFEIQNLGRPSQWLGMELKWDDVKEVVTLRQERMIEALASAAELSIGKDVPIPPGTIMMTGVKVPNDCIKRYQSLLGGLLYIANNTRPDLAYVASLLGRYSAHPSINHEKILHRSIQYLIKTKESGLGLKPASDGIIRCYADASFPGPDEEKKGQTGWILTLGGTVISWKSTKQRLTCLSSAESELLALTAGAQELVWTRQFLENEDAPPGVLLTDNAAAILIAENKKVSDKTKHIAVKEQWIKQLLEETKGEVSLAHIAGKANPADYLTKPKSGEILKRFRDQILHGIPTDL